MSGGMAKDDRGDWPTCHEECYTDKARILRSDEEQDGRMAK